MLNSLLDIAETIWPDDTCGVPVPQYRRNVKEGFLAAATGKCLANLIDLKAFRRSQCDFETFMLKQLKPLYDKKEKFEFLWEQEEILNKNTFYFTVTLQDWECKLKMGGDCTLEDLHSEIQRAVKFDNDHLYFFEIGIGKLKTQFYHPYCEEEERFADEITLNGLPLIAGQKFLYLFDFGDDWKFTVKVDRITEEETAAKIKVLEIKGKRPKQYNR